MGKEPQAAKTHVLQISLKERLDTLAQEITAILEGKEQGNLEET